MAVRFETDAEPIPGYRLLDRLGSGGFGEVWRCEAPGGIFKAVKVIHGDLRNRETDAYRFAEQELKALKRVKQVRHPYLLALDRYDIVDGRLMIVMELADCNLWERFLQCRKQGLPGIPRDELLQYMMESAEVLDLMDGKYQLQHLDIKPQNLFLLYNHVKVADFGQVKDLEGVVAQVTGGITPVYAAPETFDGFISRFCDQYSLACVYQELLTGHRPFDGSSMQQLLMQHLQAPPNLSHSPASDRPALARALSKKPEDRFPNVTSMVNALKAGNASSTIITLNEGSRVAENRLVTSVGGQNPNHYGADAPARQLSGGSHPGVATASSNSGVASHTPIVDQAYTPRLTPDTFAPPDRPAPPEQKGPGAIRPALVLALGYSGLKVLQHLRKQIEDRYGNLKHLACFRTLYLDTNPEALEAASKDPGDRDLTAIPADQIVSLKLNRAGHYLKPRANGLLVTEGWFDSQLLYKFPRSPTTMGLRQLGRLAFSDHYRVALQRIQAELESSLTPEAIAATINATGIDLRTNRPRVYIIAGSGGGTGSGIALDLAYAIKSRLRRLGYLNPEMVGLFLTPADGPTSAINPTALANTYALFTELNHFSHPETQYSATFDDARGSLADADPPFTRTYVLPGLEYPNLTSTGFSAVGNSPAVRRDSRGSSGAIKNLTVSSVPESLRAAVDFLRLDLFSNLGRVRDEIVPTEEESSGPVVQTFGRSSFSWPRTAIVDRTARIIAPVVMAHWVSPERQLLQSVVPRWVDQFRDRIGLSNELLTARLKLAASDAAGGDIDVLVSQVCETLSPRGWLGRTPEPEKIIVALDWLTKLLGPPRESLNQQPTAVQEAMEFAATQAYRELEQELTAFIPNLLDHPEFRLVGTEEAIRLTLINLEKCSGQLESRIKSQETTAGRAFDLLAQAQYQHKGTRKITAQEIADAARDYPREWLSVQIHKLLIDIYGRLHAQLLERLKDITQCRTRVEEFHQHLVADAERPAEFPRNWELLPVGCESTEDASQRFLGVLNDDDLVELEALVQRGIAEEFGGVYEACLNSTEGPDALLRIMRQTTRHYLDGRLGAIDLAGMMRQKYRSQLAVRQALEQAYQDARPGLIGNGPWTSSEVTLFAAPEGAAGTPIAQQVCDWLPPSARTVALADEIVFFREYPRVPLSSLSQLGPAWQAAYHASSEILQASAHSRVDIDEWIDVDSV